MKLASVRKTVAAVLGAGGTWCAAVFTVPHSGGISAGEWVALGIALATALGVYAVPNDPPVQTH